MNGNEGVFYPGKLLSKVSTAKPGTYVLNSTSISENNTKFAVALSNRVAQVYDVSGKLLDEYNHDKNITGIKFCSTDPLCLFTSSLDGKLNVWDVRCQGPVQTFVDNSDGILKPLLCFDHNSDVPLLCAGTELFREDAFLLFWDRRTSEILGGYWNSHTDDITQVCFHPSVTSCMASSSVDGLINVFDLNEKTEAEAINYILNVESAVNKFCWKNKDFIDCITSMEEYQMWPINEASPKYSTRAELMSAKGMKVDYFIDHLKINNSYFLASGSNDGIVCLWNSSHSYLQHGYALRGHNDIVRTICYNVRDEIILTGGEDGCICLWKVS